MRVLYVLRFVVYDDECVPIAVKFYICIKRRNDDIFQYVHGRRFLYLFISLFKMLLIIIAYHLLLVLMLDQNCMPLIDYTLFVDVDLQNVVLRINYWLCLGFMHQDVLNRYVMFITKGNIIGLLCKHRG